MSDARGSSVSSVFRRGRFSNSPICLPQVGNNSEYGERLSKLTLQICKEDNIIIIIIIVIMVIMMMIIIIVIKMITMMRPTWSTVPPWPRQSSRQYVTEPPLFCHLLCEPEIMMLIMNGDIYHDAKPRPVLEFERVDFLVGLQK